MVTRKRVPYADVPYKNFFPGLKKNFKKFFFQKTFSKIFFSKFFFSSRKFFSASGQIIFFPESKKNLEKKFQKTFSKIFF